jgi:hypothetical protein
MTGSGMGILAFEDYPGSGAKRRKALRACNRCRSLKVRLCGRSYVVQWFMVFDRVSCPRKNSTQLYF